MSTSVLVALSGGVDSATAAYFLLQHGYEVEGAFMRVWKPRTASALSDQAEAEAGDTALRLGIPFHVLDVEEAFYKQVVAYFTHTYKAGRTPNPCVMCNKKIKFSLFRQEAIRRGFQYMATGHYARNEYHACDTQWHLLEAADKSKDQSYFLSLLKQEDLAYVLFPLGQREKKDIREIARNNSFISSYKKESQEICFIPDDYASFLKRECGLAPGEGVIRDSSGTVRGKHKGYIHYTVGQRRGLGIGAPAPLYVIRIDSSANEIIVGPREEAFSETFRVADFNWIGARPAETSFTAAVRTRYNQSKITARIEQHGPDIRCRLVSVRDVITPGQAAVLYEGERVMGGGWIE